MIYLRALELPDAEQESGFFMSIKRKCYTSFYPFGVLGQKGLERLEFEPITILYGGNGSGKTTVLNVIAEKLGLERRAPFNHSSFFTDYINMCRAELAKPLPPGSRIITSDDVFEYMLDLRSINEGIDRRREEMFEDYLDTKFAHFQLHSIADYESLKKVNESRRKTQSRYVRDNLMGNTRERSNGESAFAYFVEKIGEDAMYALDEPENSLSPDRQLELAKLVADAARFFHCQFVISTHSPFFLALPGARIYDLDADPAQVKKWTQLEAMRTYAQFFRKYDAQFDQ
ncbi:MAG: AAA family ATPase [Eubacteriales bacterium]|nr:AAA family ATPase [Eubacteriales bacterium]